MAHNARQSPVLHKFQVKYAKISENAFQFQLFCTSTTWLEFFEKERRPQTHLRNSTRKKIKNEVTNEINKPSVRVCV